MAKNKVSFGQRLRTSQQILGEVLRFLRTERDLWVFPLLATIAFGVAVIGGTVALFAFDVVPKDVSGTFRVLLFFSVLGLPAMFLVSLLNTAFSFAIWGRMEGRRTTKAEAWRRALGQSGALLRFNVVAAVIGLVIGLLGAILDKLRFVPGLGHLAALVGTYGWALASFFVIPVIAVERERRAFGAVKRSVSLVREQFGTSVSGFITIQLALAVVFVPIMLLSMFGTVFYLIPALAARGVPLESIYPGLFLLATFVPALVLWVLQQALNTTYQTALYRFAVTRRINEPFSVATLHSAWEPYRDR